MKLRHLGAVLSFLACFAFHALSYAAAGDLDPSFGSGGIARISIPRTTFSTKVIASALQADGKTLVAGEIRVADTNLPKPVVGRVNRDGSVDMTFGHSGWVVIDPTSSYGLGATATAVSPTATGGFLVAFGSQYFSPSVARVRPDGAIDREFAQGFPNNFLQLWNASGDIAGLAETADGGVVVATSDTVFRFDSRGNATSFGNNGSTRISDSSVGIRALRLSADGSIFVAGWASSNAFDLQSRDMMVAKLTPSGALDANFGVGGKVVADLLFFGRDEACVLQEDAQGRLLVGGMGAGAGRAVVVRMDAVSGARDQSFGLAGIARSPIIFDAVPQIAAIQLASNGSDLIVAGYGTAAGYAVPEQSPIRSLVGRVDATGQFVQTFGINGVVVSPLASGYGSVGDAFLGLSVADGVPVAIGTRTVMSQETWTVQSSSLAQRFDEGNGAPQGDALTSQVIETISAVALRAVALEDGSTLTVGSFGKFARVMRMLPDGQLDTAFGTGGHVDFQSSGFPTAGRAIAVDSTGNILVASIVTQGPPPWRWSVSRWTRDGFADPTFQQDSLYNPYYLETEIAGVAVQGDGKVLVAGTGDGQITVARLNSDGSLDGTFNGGGIARSSLGNPAVPIGMALQPDGAVIAGGMSVADPNFPWIRLVRFTASGSQDYGFMDFRGPFFGNMVGSSLTLQDDGKILLGGSCFSYYNQSSAGCVARLMADGSTDYSFGNGGFAAEIAGSGANVTGAFAVADGKILAGGDLPGGYPFVARIRADGTNDTQYGNGGVAQTGAVQSPEWVPSANRAARLLGYSSTAAADEVVLVQFLGDGQEDVEPDPFYFSDYSGAPLNELTVSWTVTITGINVPAPISVTNGEYSIGCTGEFTSAPGSISNGETVCMRIMSSDAETSWTEGWLNVGSFQASFRVLTGILPDTTITTSPAAVTASTNATFTFVSSKPGSTFRCSLDGAAFAACASPISYAGLAEGEHRFSVLAVDAWGPDASPAEKAWRVDLTPPETTIVAGPADKDRDYDRADFTFASNEDGSSFECSLDGGAFAACATPLSYGTLPKGKHTFAVRARDAAGNVDATPATWEWKSK
jgi:uncharacterized delta-60 repeat protein